jgi:DNA-binding MarR family transcriptional regulator
MTVARKRAKPRPASKQKLRLWIRLLMTSRAIELELRERLRLQFGVTLPQFDVMAALVRQPGGMTMTEVSRHLMVSNGNVTGIIDRLVGEGMVARRTDDSDRRATFVRLTRKGTQHFDAMATAHEAWVGEILVGLDNRETDSMIDLLGSVGAAVRSGGLPQ